MEDFVAKGAIKLVVVSRYPDGVLLALVLMGCHAIIEPCLDRDPQETCG